MPFRVERYHDISTGHRVHGHEGKCQHLHGHNYRIHFICEAEALDSVGRVVDFGVVKERLCMFVERQWDHKFMVDYRDPMAKKLKKLDTNGVILMSFNPTAENMAAWLVLETGPAQLKGTGVKLVAVRIEETRKCTASYSL